MLIFQGIDELGFTNRSGFWDSGPHVSEIPQIEISPQHTNFNAQQQRVEINDLREKLKINAELQKRLQGPSGISEAPWWGPSGDLCRNIFIIFQCKKYRNIDTVYQCQTSSPLLNYLTTGQLHRPNDLHPTASASLDICPSVAPGVTKKFVGVSW